MRSKVREERRKKQAVRGRHLTAYSLLLTGFDYRCFRNLKNSESGLITMVVLPLKVFL